MNFSAIVLLLGTALTALAAPAPVAAPVAEPTVEALGGFGGSRNRE